MRRPIKPRDPVITSRIMSSVKGRNTKPERLLRSALFRLGLRFRLHRSQLPGRPDIVFLRKKVAVFVDGDFWHGSGWRERGFRRFEDQFGRNARFWIAKIKSNVERDERVNAELRRMGWRVIRLWESQVRRSPEKCALRVLNVIEQRGKRK